MSLQIVFVLSLARVVSSVNRSSLAEGERDRAGVLLPTVFITTEEGRRTSEEHMQLTLEELECVGRGVLPEPRLATAKALPDQQPLQIVPVKGCASRSVTCEGCFAPDRSFIR